MSAGPKPPGGSPPKPGASRAGKPRRKGGPPKKRGDDGPPKKRGGSHRRSGSPGGRPPSPRPGRRGPRKAASLGAKTAARPIEFPFDPGPIPEEFIQAIGDLSLFCEDLEIEFDGAAEERLARYAQRLTEANTVMNLTRGAADADELASRHLGDCLVFRSCVAGVGARRVLDVGTGAGLPAIPLAITCPDLTVVALDSRAKKIAFVRQVAEELGLDNLKPLAERAEALGHRSGYRAGFDAVVSRATANLPVLLELTVPFLKPAGYLFASKGSRAEQEIEAAGHALRELRCELVSHETYPTMQPDVEFSMLVIQKQGPTPKQFPRHPSRIKSSPLGPLTI